MVFCCTQLFGTNTFFIFLIIIFLSFKKAARGGGVYPDVMFEVAKHWYELYNKNLYSIQIIQRFYICKEIRP